MNNNDTPNSLETIRGLHKKFAASYSGGKDGALAIYRAMQKGMDSVMLLTTYNTAENRSWFHGIPENILRKISVSLGIPVTIVRTTGKRYEVNFEKVLKKAKAAGTDCCVFGDIDLQARFDWCTDRCNAAGLDAVFPLWQESREKMVREFIGAGFKAVITIVDTKQLDARFLGRELTLETAEEIRESGADICGENGEYHTFVTDGPIFKKQIRPILGDPFHKDGYAILPILD